MLNKTNPDVTYHKDLKLFAEHLIEYRKAAKMTQKELARRAGLSPNMITDIERNEKDNVEYSTVVRLANGLGLAGLQREEFFAYAKLITDEPHSNTSGLKQDVVNDFYANIRFPAFVQDCLFDLHSENSYMTGMFGMNLDLIKPVLFSSIGPNILRVLFDPILDAKNNWVGAETWYTYVSSLVYLFRIRSQKYILTERYQVILSQLMQWANFQHIWAETGQTDYRPYFPIPLEFRPNQNTRFRFIVSDATVSHFPGTELLMTYYQPADEITQRALDKIRSDIPLTMIKMDYQKNDFESISIEKLRW